MPQMTRLLFNCIVVIALTICGLMLAIYINPKYLSSLVSYVSLFLWGQEYVDREKLLAVDYISKVLQFVFIGALVALPMLGLKPRKVAIYNADLDSYHSESFLGIHPGSRKQAKQGAQQDLRLILRSRFYKPHRRRN